MAWRYMPQDFQDAEHATASWRPSLKDHTLADWPITYDDLEPCYEKAEWEIGVAGDESQNPFASPRKKPQPMPPFPYNTDGRLFEKAAKALGWHPFPLPMLRNSVPYGGRPQCIHMRSCVGFACPVDAKNGTQNTVIPRALATGNCELRTDCVAAEVMVDDRGRATGVRYFDADDRPQVQTADLVVVSASATETARLLLNSRSKLFPNGAGNNNDWVGRNLQGHAYSGASGVVRPGDLRRSRPGRVRRPVRLQPQQSRPDRRRRAGERVHLAAVLVQRHRGRPARRAGARPTRIFSGRTTSDSSRCTARCRRFPCPNPA